MKSKITMEIDFETGKPYIRVINNTVSDDVRDKLVTYFRQLLGHTSSWCKLTFPDYATPRQPEEVVFEIRPLLPEELREQGKVMLEQAELNEKYGKKVQIIYHD